MTDPTQYLSYPDYLTGCRENGENAADERTWRSWCAPAPSAHSDAPSASPSSYLRELLEQETDLKLGIREGDPVAGMLWNIIRELRLVDARLRAIERTLEKWEGDHR